MNIYPTRTSFDDAIENIMFLMKRDGREPVLRGELVIVHAIIQPKEEPRPLAHAWLENRASVYFSGIIQNERVLVEANKIEYYAQANVTKVVRYTLFEAFMTEQKHGHCGPWDADIRPLCGRSAIKTLIFRPHDQEYKKN